MITRIVTLAQLGIFNHVSYLDAIALVAIFAPSGVSKESNKRMLVIGHCVRALQNIWVPWRENAATAGNVTKMLVDRCAEQRHEPTGEQLSPRRDHAVQQHMMYCHRPPIC